MPIEYCDDGSVTIPVKYYEHLLEAIESLSEEITTPRPSSSVLYLFNVDEDSDILSKLNTICFHKI